MSISAKLSNSLEVCSEDSYWLYLEEPAQSKPVKKFQESAQGGLSFRHQSHKVSSCFYELPLRLVNGVWIVEEPALDVVHRVLWGSWTLSQLGVCYDEIISKYVSVLITHTEYLATNAYYIFLGGPQALLRFGDAWDEARVEMCRYQPAYRFPASRLDLPHLIPALAERFDLA